MIKSKIKLTIITLITSQYCAFLAAKTLTTNVALASKEIITHSIEFLGESKDFERITVAANLKESIDTDLAMSVRSVVKEELELDNGQHVAESLNSLSGVVIGQLYGD